MNWPSFLAGVALLLLAVCTASAAATAFGLSFILRAFFS